ncbi:MAG: DMT family transporter [Chloroflexota bacterium]
MTLIAVSLLLISAFLHTTWNYLLKQANEKFVATWWSLLLGSSVLLPALFFTGLPAREIWFLLLLSVVFEVGYYVLLSTAYRDLDFSMVYPIARGTAPAIVAIVSVTIFGEKISSFGYAGLAIIIGGLMIVGGSNLVSSKREKPGLNGIVIAFALSFLIAMYTLIDGNAVKKTSPFPYAVLIFFLAPVFMSPVVLKKYGWGMLKTELTAHWVRILSIGFLMVGAYILVLTAYVLSPISYASAIREVSVILGAFEGWKFLGEKFGKWRLTGSILIFSGIIVIAIFG